MALSLYEIDTRIKQIIDEAFAKVDENGEILEFDFSELEELKEERGKKLENIALYVKNLVAEVDAIKEEEKRLAERRKRLEGKSERLKGILISAIKEDGNKKISSPRVEAVIRDNDKVEIDDLEKVPAEFIVEKVEKSADKMAIKKAIKAGAEVSGATLTTNTTISIK